ncbi:MAG TPA: antibiotic biosynthesis monooxygenase [Alphaproteobacteria bacterium]
MIVRIWRGQAERDRAQAYHDHVTGRVFPALTRISGHRGAYLLRRDVGTRVEFLAVTLWDSLDTVKSFAGPDPDVAVVEPEARAVLAEFDDFARHYEVAHGAPCAPPAEA